MSSAFSCILVLLGKGRDHSLGVEETGAAGKTLAANIPQKMISLGGMSLVGCKKCCRVLAMFPFPGKK